MVLKIETKDSLQRPIETKIAYNRFFTSEEELRSEVDGFEKKLDTIGYLEHTIVKTIKTDSLTTVHFYVGKKITHVKIYYNSAILNITDLTPFSKNISESYFVVPFKNISKVLKSISQMYEEKGFSFSEIQLRNIHQESHFLNATLQISNLQPRSIDQIIVKGYDHFPKKFLRLRFGIKKGRPFSLSQLKTFSKEIQSLSFASELKSPEILFTKDSTSIYLYLEKQKTNNFDALLGFSSNTDGKIAFNGYFNIYLNNAFNKGESLQLKWQRTPEERNSFDLEIETPYIFNLPVTPKLHFTILKQDSSYIKTAATIDLAVQLNLKNSLGATYESATSDPLSRVSIANIDAFNAVFYGFHYLHQTPNNNPLFPIRFSFFGKALLGNRKENSNNVTQQKFMIDTQFLWNLNSKNNLFIKNQSGLLQSNDYLLNEIFRIGGTNSIRGFNEASIFTTGYSVLNIEYRYLTNRNSYIYSITDFANIKQDLQTNFTQLYSFGIGYALKNKLGILNLSYAIGKRNDTPFDLRASKLHLHYLYLF